MNQLPNFEDYRFLLHLSTQSLTVSRSSNIVERLFVQEALILKYRGGYWGVGLKQPAMILRYNDNHK